MTRRSSERSLRRRTGRISVAYYTDARELGGAELSLANLLAALPGRVDATVVGTDRDVVERLASARTGTPAVVVPRIRSLLDLRSINAHGRAFLSLKPDIVQVTLNHPWACTWAQLVAATIPGVRVIAIEQLPREPLHRWDPLVKRLIERGVDAHVVVGARSADELARITGLRRASLRTIHNGIPDLELEPLPRVPGGFVVGSLGRLHAQKGYDVLVRALARLEGVTAVLVGDGEERQELLELAAALGVADRFVVRGWADDARRHLAGFDAFVLPSRFEAFPLSIVEAMLAGLPVVAGDVGSVSEAVVDGSTGLLVPAGDVDALVVAIERLRADATLREEMGARGRRRALDLFTAEAMAARFDALYDEVVG